MKKATLILLGLFFVLVPANAQQKADPPPTKAAATAPAVNKDTVIQIQDLELQQARVQLDYSTAYQKFVQSPEVQALQTRATDIQKKLAALKAQADAAQRGKYELDLRTSPPVYIPVVSAPKATAKKN